MTSIASSMSAAESRGGLRRVRKPPAACASNCSGASRFAESRSDREFPTVGNSRRYYSSEAVGQVDTRRERLVGFDASKTRLGQIFRKHALQLSTLVSEVVDKRRSAPLIMLNSRADIDQVIPGQLSVRTGEFVRV